MIQHNKWKEDLTDDLLYFDGESEFEPHNHPIGYDGRIEFTSANRQALLERFLRVRDDCQTVVEIGVCRNGNSSSTHVFLENKKPETIYIGIDIEDKSFLNDHNKNIYTFKNDSSNIENIWQDAQKLGAIEIGFLFIDGWHTINQVKRDWEYTRYLSQNGIVGFHDTSCHPGPKQFIKALNRNKWEVEENICPADWGIGFTWLKK